MDKIKIEFKTMNFFPNKMRKRFKQRGINQRKEEREREGEGEAVLTVSQSVNFTLVLRG